jgi:serine/threonine protein kinase
LPRVLDYGQHDGRLFIVTDWIDGLPLDNHCEQHRLDRKARVALLARVADAVQMLHEHGVIHRDLKPSNILVDSHGNPMIVDFGLAAILAGGDPVQTLSTEGAPLGTPAFMSPEQARGERVGTGTDGRSGVSTRSDVYSLGATAYVILTGNTPHDMECSLHEAIRRVSSEMVREPRSLDRTLPKDLASILRKACAAKPADRYESAESLAEDLRRWMTGKPVRAGSVTFWRRTVEFASVHPFVVTIALCTIIAAISITATVESVWWLRRAPSSVKKTQDGHAQLLSLVGNVLYQWGDGKHQFVQFISLVDRPSALGGGKVVLVGFSLVSDQSRLCAFDAFHPEHLLWSTPCGLNALTVPPAPRGYRKDPYFVMCDARIADVFPESPGPEIIVLHLDWRGDAGAVRIYDLAGKVLYEAWHSGHLKDSYWLGADKVLVLSGVNSEAFWRSRGHPDAPYMWPLVVMGIQPVCGERWGWITTSTLAGDLQPQWYRCVTPAELPPDDRWIPGLNQPQAAYADPDKAVTVILDDAAWIFIDGHGNPARPPLVLSTARLKGENPLLKQIGLGDLPPIQAQTTPAAIPAKK